MNQFGMKREKFAARLLRCCEGNHSNRSRLYQQMKGTYGLGFSKRTELRLFFFAGNVEKNNMVKELQTNFLLCAVEFGMRQRKIARRRAQRNKKQENILKKRGAVKITQRISWNRSITTIYPSPTVLLKHNNFENHMLHNDKWISCTMIYGQYNENNVSGCIWICVCVLPNVLGYLQNCSSMKVVFIRRNHYTRTRRQTRAQSTTRLTE